MADNTRKETVDVTVPAGHNIFKQAPRPDGERGHVQYIPDDVLTGTIKFASLPILQDDARRSGGDCVCTVQTCSENGCGYQKPIRLMNQQLSQGDFERAFFAFGRVSPFFIGSMCAAGCTTHCVVAANNPNEAVAINFNEQALEEYGWKNNLFPKLFEPPEQETGKKITIIGGGIAGLQAAWEARKAGHDVTIIERSGQLGGLMTEGKGIPPWKSIRNFGELQTMLTEQMGIKVQLNTEVGKDVDIVKLKESSDALVIATGVADAPRRIKLPGGDAQGVYQAMEFLGAQAQAIKAQVEGDVTAYDFGRDKPHEAPLPFDFKQSPLYLGDKNVLIYGGGLTGEDILAWTSKQIEAEKRSGGTPGTVTTIIRQPEPGEQPSKGNGWPNEADHFKMSTQLMIAAKVAGSNYNPRTHDASIDSVIKDDAGKMTGVKVTITQWPLWLNELTKEARRDVIKEKDIKPIRQETIEMKADALILALGFEAFHSRPPKFVEPLGIQNDAGKVDIRHGRTSVPGVYVVGDASTMLGNEENWVLHAAGGQARDVMTRCVFSDVASGATKDAEQWRDRYTNDGPYTRREDYKQVKTFDVAAQESVGIDQQAAEKRSAAK